MVWEVICRLYGSSLGMMNGERGSLKMMTLDTGGIGGFAR